MSIWHLCIKLALRPGDSVVKLLFHCGGAGGAEGATPRPGVSVVNRLFHRGGAEAQKGLLRVPASL